MSKMQFSYLIKNNDKRARKVNMALNYLNNLAFNIHARDDIIPIGDNATF